jgi:hypothetical protein
MRTSLFVLLVCIGVFAQADPRTKELRDYLKENFGIPGYAASWYKAVKDVRVEGDIAVAQVTGQGPAVCAGLSGFIYDRTRKHGLKSVKVVGSDGKVLIDRKTVAQPCK